MRPDPPVVSVVIHGSRGGADFDATVASIHRQTFSDVEIISAAKPGAAALNAAAERTRGSYVAFLQAGIQWPSDFVAAHVRFLEQHASCGVVGAGDVEADEWALPALIEHAPAFPLSAALVRRDPAMAAGLFDEGIREGYDTDLWLRLALRGVTVGVSDLPDVRENSVDTVHQIEALVSVLERFAYRHLLDAPARTAIRVRIMRLIDRLEIEQAKCRILEGHFDAARFHLSCARRPSWQVRAALIALRLTPRLARAFTTFL